MSPVAEEQQNRVELKLDGMTCASCAARIERKLNKLAGVRASVNFATERAAVSYDPQRVDLGRLIATVEQSGYRAALPRATELSKSDPLLPRLVGSVVLTAPLVMVAMVSATQFGGWKWGGRILSAPGVFWGGWQFHRAAIVNARHGSATMDTLVSVGTLAAWLWSAVVLIGGLDASV